MDKTCSVDGCTKPTEKRGWCGMHYRRWQRHGDVEILRKRPNGSGCVYIDAEGYFRVQFGRKSQKLHRLIMEAIVGRPLLRSEHVHHKDENKLNNNPENLELLPAAKHISIHHLGVPDHGINSSTQRYCKCCDKVKTPADFYKAKGEKRGGRRTYCIECTKIQAIKYAPQRREYKRRVRAKNRALKLQSRQATPPPVQEP